MSEREVDKTPPHDCGFHRGEGASCAFHEKWNQRGVAHPDGGAPPCEECGAAITGGALECPKCDYIQQGGAPPEPSAWVTLREMVAFDSRDWSVSPKDAMLYGIIVGWDAPALAELAEIHGWDERFRNRLAALHDDYMALRVRAASRPGHP
jgi:hypothetical protein